MKRSGGYLIMAALSIFLSACASTPANKIVKPIWIDKPENGVSASAGVHYLGNVAQEEMAIERARKEYAKRFGVTISAEQVTTTSVANDHLSSHSNGISNETVNQSNVKAVVKEKWRDPETSVLWVWLVPSN